MIFTTISPNCYIGQSGLARSKMCFGIYKSPRRGDSISLTTGVDSMKRRFLGIRMYIPNHLYVYSLRREHGIGHKRMLL